MKMKWKDVKDKTKYDDMAYEDLYANVISDDIDTLQGDYNAFIEARAKMLPATKEIREQIEAKIRLDIVRIWSKAKHDANGPDEEIGYFKYRPFLDIPEIKEYFKIFGAIGDRNIGKTWSSREEVDEVIAKGRKFMILRGIDDEIESQLTSDMGDQGWLRERGYEYEGKLKSPTVVKYTYHPETGKIVDRNTVGYYRPVNTASKFKSVDFPNTDLVIYEEFSEGNVQNKFYKFVKFLSTVMRSNTNGITLLQSNYTDQNDDMLMALGVGAKKLTKDNFVHFNWEVGAIIIFIPKGIYRKPEEKKDIAYRASLGKFEVWKNQYGGGFNNEEPVNIINETELAGVEPVFNIYYVNSTVASSSKGYGAYKMTMFHACDNEGNMHNVLTEQVVPNDCPVIIYDVLNKVQYPHAHLMEINNLASLLNDWNTGNLKTTNLMTHSKICALFASALKHLLKEDGNIEEIENIVV